jgi:hypothetical protein
MQAGESDPCRLAPACTAYSLYLTVYVHHPIYAVASSLHGIWNYIGLRYEIRPFADHTVHFTLADIRALIASLPFRVVTEDTGIAAAMLEAKSGARWHLGNRLKRTFFKNARYEIVAERTQGRCSPEDGPKGTSLLPGGLR